MKIKSNPPCEFILEQLLLLEVTGHKKVGFEDTAVVISHKGWSKRGKDKRDKNDGTVDRVI